MKLETQLALDALNRRFYAERAGAFSASRDHAWPGWTRLLENPVVAARSPAAHRGEDVFAVLDAGCGNGRFLGFLAQAWRDPFAYVGCDSAPELLAIAAAQAPARIAVEFGECDLSSESLSTHLPARCFDLVAVFGVLHHIPGAEARRRLLDVLASRVAPGGFLAVTLWRFGERERFARRILPWAEYNASAELPIDESELENGDVLLRWGDTPGPPRYCHLIDEHEIDSLLATLQTSSALELIDRYRADGKSGDLNDYLVLQRPDPLAPRASAP